MARTGTGCVFCAIADGEVSGFVVAETGDAIAFLDTRPVFPGHTLVVPKPHVETLTDLPGAAVAGYFTFVRAVSAAVEAGLAADGTYRRDQQQGLAERPAPAHPRGAPAPEGRAARVLLASVEVRIRRGRHRHGGPDHGRDGVTGSFRTEAR
jgi:hypothetical protein